MSPTLVLVMETRKSSAGCMTTEGHHSANTRYKWPELSKHVTEILINGFNKRLSLGWI